MSLAQILFFSAAALLLGLVPYRKVKQWGMFLFSLAALYILQPAIPIRTMNFWLPTASLALAILGWAATLPSGKPWRRFKREDGLTLAFIFLLVISAPALQSWGYSLPGSSMHFPPLEHVALAMGALGLVVIMIWVLGLSARLAMWLGFFFICGLVMLFFMLKTDEFSALISAWLRYFHHQDPALASSTELRWLGFSYLSFRLIHTLRERAKGNLATLSLQEYFTYMLFFPAITAGPIDRVERFDKDWQQLQPLDVQRCYSAGQRLLWGMVKKFVVADSLGLIALNQQNAQQVGLSGWLWVLTYCYAFQLYFDFSGYTDIAIGMAEFLGIHLPENFRRPYLQSNISTFWNCWHISLTQWFRAYVFNPLARSLRKHQFVPEWLAILICQSATMLLIGLWHGVSGNYLMWGLWHAFGLFIHNRWAAITRPLSLWSNASPFWQKVGNGVGMFLTFNYVALGWVWFSLPSVSVAWHTLQKMFLWG